MVVAGARVLVSGAGRGMGLMYVERALEAGATTVVAWDVDASALEGLAAGLDGAGLDVTGRLIAEVVDLGDPSAVADAASALAERIGGVDILINNAGIITGNELFWEIPDAEIGKTLDVNAAGHMHLTRALLPGMIASGRQSRIVNIASAAANTPNPRMSVYAASKAALALWSESLRVELAGAGHDHVRVTTVYPSYVSTGMFSGARGPLLTPIVAPERVVDAVWAALERGRPAVMIPAMTHVGKVLRGVLPPRAWDAVARLFRVYGSMDAFTGRG